MYSVRSRLRLSHSFDCIKHLPSKLENSDWCYKMVLYRGHFPALLARGPLGSLGSRGQSAFSPSRLHLFLFFVFLHETTHFCHKFWNVGVNVIVNDQQRQGVSSCLIFFGIILFTVIIQFERLIQFLLCSIFLTREGGFSWQKTIITYQKLY
jgi:hypothetical protein